MAEKLGSDINERLLERRLKRHRQAMAELQRDLASVSEVNGFDEQSSCSDWRLNYGAAVTPKMDAAGLRCTL